MKKIHICALPCLLAAGMLLTAATPDDGIMTKEKGTYIVNTTKLAADVEGYEGPTPLKIYIKGGRIAKVEALRNDETPQYFAKVKKQLLDKWNGMTVGKAATADVDGVTGATFSANAVKENMRRGLEYYKKHK